MTLLHALPRRAALLVLLFVSAASAENARPAAARSKPDPRPTEPIHPLTRAEVGDWAAYSNDNAAIRYCVTRTTLVFADVEVRTLLAGRPLGKPATSRHRQDFDLAAAPQIPGLEQSTSTDVVDAAGRRFRCRRTIARWKSGESQVERRIWQSDDVPVFGLVRQEMAIDGHTVSRLQLSAFGRAVTSQPAS